MNTDNHFFRGTMETHLAFVFSVWPRSQTEERWAADPLRSSGMPTREGASAGQDTHPPPVPGGVRSGHTSTSHPWEGGRVQQRGGTEISPKTRTQHLKDKAASPHSFILSTKD